MKRFQEFSPSGLTPKSKTRQPLQRGPSRAARPLFPTGQEQMGGAQQWSRHEEERLLQFLSRKQTDGAFSAWPTFTDAGLWLAASEAVTEQKLRSSMFVVGYCNSLLNYCSFIMFRRGLQDEGPKKVQNAGFSVSCIEAL